MLLEHPDPKWREAGRTGKWRRVPADDVARREDFIRQPDADAKPKKARAPKEKRPSHDLPAVASELREGWARPDHSEPRESDDRAPWRSRSRQHLGVRPDAAIAGLEVPLPAAPNGKTTGGGDPLPRSLRDADVSDLREYVQHYGFPRISRDISHEAADKRARELSFHPVRRWLNGLIWDGTPRLDGWLASYLGSPSDQRISQRHWADVPDLDGGAHLQTGLQGRLHAGVRRRTGRGQEPVLRHPRRRVVQRRSARSSTPRTPSSICAASG